MPATAGAAHGAGFHDDDHGLGLARGNQVVEDQVGVAHFDPDPLILASAVLQIQHRVAGLGLLHIPAACKRRCAARHWPSWNSNS